jgi:hypothetical protein
MNTECWLKATVGSSAFKAHVTWILCGRACKIDAATLFAFAMPDRMDESVVQLKVLRQIQSV